MIFSSTHLIPVFVRNGRLNAILSTTIILVFCFLLNGHVVEGSSSLAAKRIPLIRCAKDKYGNKKCNCRETPITERYLDTTAKHCEFYYLCHLGVAVKMQCAPNMAFHPKLMECIPRDRIPKSICKPLVDCPVRPNRYVEDTLDCSKYYLCFYGKPLHYTCPDNTYFEPEGEKCLYDRTQRKACSLAATTNYNKLLGYNNNPPPKTSYALTQAKRYREQAQKNDKNKKRG